MSQIVTQQSNLGNYFYFLDSKDRKGNSISNENCQFVIEDMSPNERKSISIESIVIPNSYYSINSNNSSFVLLGTTSETITLPVGNYTSTTYATQLLTSLNASAFGTAHAFSTVAYSSLTGKITITNATTDFSITSNTTNYRYLGLPISTTLASSSKVWVSTNVCDFSGTRYIDMISDIPLASVNTGNPNNNLLSRIWCNISSFGTIFYASSNFDYMLLRTNRIGTLRLQLLDEFGNTIDLNGLNWSCTLEVKCHAQLS